VIWHKPDAADPEDDPLFERDPMNEATLYVSSDGSARLVGDTNDRVEVIETDTIVQVKK